LSGRPYSTGGIIVNDLSLFFNGAIGIDGISAFNQSPTELGNATLQGGVTHTTADGGAFVFNGTDGYMSTADQVTNNPQQFTLEAWIKTTDTSHKIMGFESHQTGASASYDRMIYIDSGGYVRFGVYPGGVVTLRSNTIVNDDAWHHVVATYDGSTLRMYVDNVAQGTASAAFAQNYSGYWRLGGYKLGAWTYGTNGYYTGSIGEARIYYQALSSISVASNYNTTKARYGV
jgi:trimeric autotransporter adhesin